MDQDEANELHRSRLIWRTGIGSDSAMPPMTTLQRALHKALEHGAQHLDHAFFRGWQETGTDRVGPIKELVWRRCTVLDEPLQGLVWMGHSVKKLDWLSARNRMEAVATVVELVELMTLVLWERRILEVVPPSEAGRSPI